jgi:hypothetical protein
LRDQHALVRLLLAPLLRWAWRGSQSRHDPLFKIAMMSSPEKPLLGTVSEKKGRHNGRLVLGYGHVTTLLLTAFLLGVVLHSQFQTACRVWEHKGSTLTVGSKRDEARNVTSKAIQQPLLASSHSMISLRETDERTINMKSSKAGKSPKQDTKTSEDDDSNRPWPRIVWLMSFPNSGKEFNFFFVQKVLHFITNSLVLKQQAHRTR